MHGEKSSESILSSQSSLQVLSCMSVRFFPRSEREVASEPSQNVWMKMKQLSQSFTSWVSMLNIWTFGTSGQLTIVWFSSRNASRWSPDQRRGEAADEFVITLSLESNLGRSVVGLQCSAWKGTHMWSSKSFNLQMKKQKSREGSVYWLRAYSYLNHPEGDLQTPGCPLYLPLFLYFTPFVERQEKS